MVNSQEQSLDEETVFVPVNESSPEYLHCEKERQAVERLLNAGTAAFYSSIDTERSSCFLSSEEVSQISSWAQDYCFSPLQVQREADGEEGSSEREDFCSTYFPSHSDTPPPNLELGWPEKCQWAPKGSVTVHTSPPAEGEPPVRGIIRRHLQKATKVIAIVTDRLTDGSIIGDLHGAASRGVPVYIILNQRSIQENFTLNRLGHPNMQVRVLGGKTFCSRTGRMVVGEMKDKFLLVDLETVIHGSYSLTWTDAHLHRQLITVLSGPVVDSFDREFRILFAASLPVPDTWRVAGTHVYVTHRLKDISDLRFKKPFPLDSEISNPPSPPPDSLLDWAAMGVVQRECSFLDSPLDQQEEIMAKEMMNNRSHFVDMKRVCENTPPVINNVPDKSTTFNITQPLLTDLKSPERRKREDCITEKAPSRQLSVEKSTHLNDRTTTRLGDKAIGPANNMVMRSSTERKECSILEEKRGINETSKPKVENTPSSRKPIILRIPQSDSYSCLSDIMKRFRPQQSTSGLFRRGSKAAVSEMSRSMMDLSMHNTDTNHGDRGNPVPRFRASCLDPGLMTPALALMKKRNDDMKSVLYRTPKTFLPRERPRSSRYSLSMDWRRSLAEKEEDPE